MTPRLPLRFASLTSVIQVTTWVWLLFWFWHARHFWEDDAFIHLEYARSVFEGHGFMFNGVLSNGDTAPAWVLLLAPLYPLTHDWVLSGKILTVLALLFTLWNIRVFSWRIAEHLDVEPRQWSALMTGLFVLGPYFCYWVFSGMEAILAAGWLMLQCSLLVPRKASNFTFLASAAAVGIGPLLRPEFLFMGIIAVPFWLLQIREIRKVMPPGPTVALFATGASIAITPILMWFAYSMDAFGYVIPNTNAAKQAAPGEAVLPRMMGLIALGFPGVFISLAAIFLSMIGIATRNTPGEPKQRAIALPPKLYSPLIAWIAAVLVFYVINRSFVQTRYIIVFGPILVMMLLATLYKRATPAIFVSAVAATALAQILLSGLMAYPSVRNKGVLVERVSAFINDIQAKIPAHEPLAVYGIGQIGFYLDNPIIDIGAITDPGAAPYLYKPTPDMAQWAMSKGASYYVWGQKPLPDAIAVIYSEVPDTGWFLKPEKYNHYSPLVLWKLPPQLPSKP